MAKINKIRIINFTYNENRHIYDQTFNFYNGKDTLLNLQNGGGKTVLVQMMMQPIIPKQKLKNRMFKNYFVNSKAPTYIMIEWALDDGVTKVLTGIGIKKTLAKSIEDEEAGNLKIITFISEYEKVNLFDIDNISLLEKEKGIIKLIDFEKVIKILSNAEKEGEKVSLFRWDLSDAKKEYSQKLSSYKINQSEWKNLMVKINESEAGLNSFFNDCKSNNALIKKWFIPTIEEQLNRKGNLVQNIKELIKNHSEQIINNEEILNERRIFEDFKNKSTDLLESLKKYQVVEENIEKCEFDLGNAYLYISSELKNFESKLTQLFEELKDREKDLKEVEYEKLSKEYYAISSEIERLKDNIVTSQKESDKLNNEKIDLEYKKNIMECSKLNYELTKLNTQIAKFETELEKENMENQEIEKIVLNLEYSLKEKYKQKIHSIKELLNNEQNELGNIKDSIYDLNIKLKNENDNANFLNEELLKIKSKIVLFNENIKSLKLNYKDLEQFISGDENLNYIIDTEILEKSLSETILDIDANIEKLKNMQVNINKEIEDINIEEEKIRLESSELLIAKNKSENEWDNCCKEKNEIERIIDSYQLGVEIFDKESILLRLNSETEKYNKFLLDKNLENLMVKNKLKVFESGKVFELSEDLEKLFYDRNIFFEFGYEWLKNLTENKNIKLKLVKNNPFLPYAIILAKKDFELLKNTELDVFTTAVIPIIEKDKLESELKLASNNNVYSFENIEFLISFDDKILNKNYIKQEIDELSEVIRKNDEQIRITKASLKNTEINILKVEQFKFEKIEVEKLKNEIFKIDEKIKEEGEKVSAIKGQKINLENEQLKYNNELRMYENEKISFARKENDIDWLLKSYVGYKQALSGEKQIEPKLKISKENIKLNESDISKYKEEIFGKENKIKINNDLLDKTKMEFEKYESVSKGNFIDEKIEVLEAKLKSITSKISGKIQTLRDILEDYKQRRNNTKKTLESYSIDETHYIGQPYNDYEFSKINEEIKDILKIINENHNKENEINYSIAEKNSDIRYTLKSINEKCGYSEVKAHEHIREIDFEKHKNQILEDLKQFNKDLSRIKSQNVKLQKVYYVLEEYAIFSKKVDNVIRIDEKLDEYTLEVIKKYKDLKIIDSKMRNQLMENYNEVENEFISKGEVFNRLFKTILSNDKKLKAVYSINAFNRLFMQMDKKLEQHDIDIKKIDNMEKCIIDNTVSYLKNVYDELNSIDKHSIIEYDNKRCKMLIINLPIKKDLEIIPIKEYLKNTIKNCVDLFKNNKCPDSLLDNEINTFDLFDRLVSMNKIQIHLLKIEPNRVKKKTWKQVIEENSGGETFVSAFVVFISLLTYMRGDEMIGDNQDSKVLIMDNPFGPITSAHLLKPLFEISKKYNTQLICLSDLKEHNVLDRFDLIYTLNIEREIGKEDEYIDIKTIKKDIDDEDTSKEELVASMFKIEDKSRFELSN